MIIIGKVKVIKNGKQVASAQNLEVVLRYQRTHSSIKSVIQRDYDLHVKYDDGASLKTTFASKDVLSNWIYQKRRRGVFPAEKKKIKGIDFKQYTINMSKKKAQENKDFWIKQGYHARVLPDYKKFSTWRSIKKKKK